MRAATGSAFARAALAGNPSDGYGGRTLAVCVRDFAATARAEPAARPGVDVRDEGIERLARAALARFPRLVGQAVPPATVRVETNVPRQLGLAGSSAIVIAVLRALAAAVGARLDPEALAREALLAETEELGIAAGPQDRLVQVHGGLVFMDFGAGVLEPLDPGLLPALFLAHRSEPGEPSGVVHAALRQRFTGGDPVVVEGMRALARIASAAREALLARDHAAFARCLDASFDVRARMVALDPRDSAAISIARAHGAAANYAGSGGAVVGTAPTEGLAPLAKSLEAAGWAVLRPVVS